MFQKHNLTTLPDVEAILAFGAALLTLRLAGLLAKRWRERRQPHLLAWSAGLAAYALGAGAIAAGAAETAAFIAAGAGLLYAGTVAAR